MMRDPAMSWAPRPRRPALLVLALPLAAHSAAHFVAVVRVVGSIGGGRPIRLFGGLVVTSSWAVGMLLALVLMVAGTGFLIASRLLAGGEAAVGPLLVLFACLSLMPTVAGLWATTGGVLVNLTVLTVVPGMTRPVDAQQSERSVFADRRAR